jgi:ParB family transcriptional regulator, chromosome partitioning protein
MSRTDEHLSRIGDQLAKNLGGEGVRQAIAAPEKTARTAIPARNFWHIPIEDIGPDPLQPREEFDLESLELFAKDIAKRGLLQPIRVRKGPDGKHIIISGERRWRAAKLAGTIRELPCFVMDHAMTEAAILEDQLCENLHRAELSEIEKAKGFFQLIAKNGWTQAGLAQALNLSDASVSRILKLLELPDVIRQQVAEGKISASTAYEIGRIADPEQQKLLAERAVASGLSRADVTAAVQEQTGRRDHKPTRSGHRLTCRLADGTAITLSNSNQALTTDHIIEALSQVLSKAKKLRSKNLTIDQLPALLKSIAKDKAEETPPADSASA